MVYYQVVLLHQVTAYSYQVAGAEVAAAGVLPKGCWLLGTARAGLHAIKGQGYNPNIYSLLGIGLRAC